MLRKLIAPEYIFTVAVCSALLPYLLLQFGLISSTYRVTLTYLPVALWVLGWFCFLLGCVVAKRARASSVPFTVRESAYAIVSVAAGLGVVFAMVQLYLVGAVYGGFPILSYLLNDGSMDVGTANQLQENSAYGQMGLLTFTLYSMSSVILLLLVIRHQRKRGSLTVIYICIALLAFAHIVNGKRQGLYSFAFFIIVGLCHRSRGVSELSRYLGLPRRSVVVAALLITLGGAGVMLFESIGSIRNQGRQQGGTLQSLAYLEYPLLNFEAQCAQAGLGPYEFKPLGIFRQLVPYKSLSSISSFLIQEPPTVERSAPAGMLEYFQWCYGPAGVAGYCFLLGWFARTAYQKARSEVRWLLIYCYLAVCLSLAHSNNQLLATAYVPGPAFVALVLCAFIGKSKRSNCAEDSYYLVRSSYAVSQRV